MEETRKHEELKSILEGLQKALELYNDLNPQEKLEITPQGERKDVSDIFICVYNDKHIGLFKKINWYTRKYDSVEYAAGSIYVGIDSDYIGMKGMHPYYTYENRWQPVGKKVIVCDKCYISNCIMQNSMSFDDMRLIMYSDGQIKPYEIGKASSKEMIDVLKYAFSYYQLDQINQNIQRQRLKLDRNPKKSHKRV